MTTSVNPKQSTGQPAGRKACGLVLYPVSGPRSDGDAPEVASKTEIPLAGYVLLRWRNGVFCLDFLRLIPGAEDCILINRGRLQDFVETLGRL